MQLLGVTLDVVKELFGLREQTHNVFQPAVSHCVENIVRRDLLEAKASWGWHRIFTGFDESPPAQTLEALGRGDARVIEQRRGDVHIARKGIDLGARDAPILSRQLHHPWDVQRLLVKRLAVPLVTVLTNHFTEVRRHDDDGVVVKI